MALTKDEIMECLVQAGLDQTARQKAAKEIELAEADKKANSGSAPKSKFKYTIVVRGDKALATTLQAGWIVKTKEEQDDNELIDRMTKGAANHNTALKRRKGIVATWRDYFLLAKRKITKAPDVAVQTVTKEAVRVVVLEDENIKFD